MKDLMKKAHQMTDKVVCAAGDAMDKAKNFIDSKAEPIKLEWEISKKKASLEALLLEYGKACYYETASEEEKYKCRQAILEIEDEIKALNEELEEIKAEEARIAEEKATVFCTNCGAVYKDKEKYCKKCGNKL